VFAEGTGNRFSPVSVSLWGYTLVLIHPQIHVSTKEAYAGVQPRQPKESIREIIQRPVEEWRERLSNDFEESIFEMYPKIGEIKQEMYNRGADYASMSGSGSTVFGLFRSVDRNDAFFRDSTVVVI
jgi:4-diphosphocytidyl-2-C-methyl-D-erythritol kinase